MIRHMISIKQAFLAARVTWVVIVLSCGLLHAQRSPTTIPADQVARIERTISTHMSARNIPALSIAIAKDGQIVFSGAYGLVNLEHSVVAKTDHVFRIASISK